jgi:hypothetical protein
MTGRGARRLACILVSLSLIAVGGAAAAQTTGRGASTQETVAGSLVELTQQANKSWISLNLTSAYGGGPVVGDGVPVVDPVTGYQNAYIVDSRGHLLEYTRFPDGSWSYVDLTSSWQMPAVKGRGVAPFVDPVSDNQAVVAADTAGELEKYSRATNGSWSALSLAPSLTIQGTPQPTIDPLTRFQNVYAVSSTGDLIEYTTMLASHWTTLDVTNAAHGVAVTGTPEPFVDPVTGFENVYVTSATGHLIEYTRLADGSWITLDLSVVSGLGANLAFAGTAQPFVDLATGVQTVFATSRGGQLYELARRLNGSWGALDVSSLPGQPQVGSDPIPFDYNIGGSTEHLFYDSTAGQMWESIEQPNGSWTPSDITQMAGGPYADGTPEPFVDPLTHLLNVYYDSALITIIQS